MEETGQGGGADPEPEPGDGGEPEGDGEAIMSRQMFAGMLAGIFGLSGGVTGLQTLETAPQRRTFLPAAAAFYDVCLDTPALRFLVMEDSKTVQQCVAIGAFVAPLSRACVEEVRAKRARPVNDNRAADQAAADAAMAESEAEEERDPSYVREREAA